MILELVAYISGCVSPSPTPTFLLLFPVLPLWGGREGYADVASHRERLGQR